MDNYNYGIIGNCTSAALISPDCSIDWLCLPFFDSGSIFARILDEQKGGHFKISGVDTVSISQNYIPHTSILRTIFETKKGTFEVRDYMPRFITSREEYYCPSEIHRDILVVSGKPEIKIELYPRPNYAKGSADFIYKNEYLKIISKNGEYNSFYVYTNLDFKSIMNSEPIVLREASYIVLSYHEKLEPVDIDRIYIEYEKTKTYWLDWVYRTKVPAKYKEILIRSAITLKLLTYQKTGAVIAAPTTSLPEIIGKDRNWDYRYCWVRDAAMVVDLYTRIGHINTATRFMKFILNRMLLKHENIRVVYGINGEKELPERILDHLDGYKHSRPVRIGNDAYRQKQNDLYGELIEAIYTYFIINRRDRFHLNEEIWTVVRSLVNDVLNTWREPDSGIWERRHAINHYVSSKLMNWVAIDRASKIANFIGKPHYAKKWENSSSEIREDILRNGWNDKIKSFTMAYGSEALDASILLMLHYGFLPNNDSKIISTVKCMYNNLVKNGFVFRYTSEDEFGIPENAFIVTTFWMINALYLIGEKQKAETMFNNILQCRNKLGLFSEAIDTSVCRLTGNFPQGYSHLALIQTILLMETNYNWSDASEPLKKTR